MNASMSHRERKQRMLLGLAILEATLPPGPRSLAQISAFCDCSRQAIQQIEAGAVKKMQRRAQLQEHKKGQVA